ncbi:MAG: hypothetical protein OXN86_08250 [Chloroflexota bacterium]|nr:hypothetical protein [Chloroflexota bacterium]
MAFPNFPNPARRARILEAFQLRTQGLTIRQIGHRMNCSVSTAHGYLRDYELFRLDLVRELAADQIVNHLIHLGHPAGPQNDQKPADLRELRLLLASLSKFRSDDEHRTRQLNRGGVAVDQYGNRHPVRERFHAPTPEEEAEIQQLPDDNRVAGRPNPDVPLAYIPEPARTDPSADEHSSGTPSAEEAPHVPSPPAPRGEMPKAEGGLHHTATEPIRTKPNTAEQESAPDPAHNGKSADPEQNSLPPSLQQAIDDIERQLQEVLRHRDWLNDYPRHNPNHPQRQRALRLVKRRDALLAQAARAPAA